MTFWNKLRDLFAMENMGNIVTSLPYVVLWLFGIVETYSSVAGKIWDGVAPYIGESDSGHDLRFFIYCAGLATIAHMFFLYMSLHEIERQKPRWIGKYPAWVGNKMEVWLRLIIFLLLLIASGEIGHELDAKRQSLVCLGMFFSLLVWDLASWGPLVSLCQRSKWSVEKVQFIVSDWFGLLYWGMTMCVLLDIMGARYFVWLNILLGVIYIVIILARGVLYLRNNFQVIPEIPQIPQPISDEPQQIAEKGPA